MSRKVVCRLRTDQVRPTLLAQIEQAVEDGEFDCEDGCDVQIHIHAKLLGIVVDVQSRHARDCPSTPPDVAARIAGREGLN